MQEVTLKDSRMFVWPGVHAEAGENVRVLARDSVRAFVLTDRNCLEIARRVAMSLQMARFEVSGGVLPPSKGALKANVVAKAQARLEGLPPEGTSLVAVGGSALLHHAARLAGERPRFYVPTTLRAQLDTALGGSSCPRLGAWTPAVAVFSDPTLLRTLPLREFLGGMAEAVKCALVQDPDLLEFLDAQGMALRDRGQNAIEELMWRAGTVKAAAVNSPTPGPGARATFHYGHGVGGALERLAGAAVIHGEALAVGMEAEVFLARRLGWVDDEVPQAQNRLLKSFGLPTRAKGLPADRLAQALLERGPFAPDLPDSLGHARGPAEVPADLLKAAIAFVTK